MAPFHEQRMNANGIPLKDRRPIWRRDFFSPPEQQSGSSITPEDYLTAVFIRDPLERLVSFYKQKLHTKDWTMPTHGDLDVKYMRDEMLKRCARFS